MKTYLGGKRVRLDPKNSIGTGGEADVYRIGGGRALKLFKGPKHPDVAGIVEQELAAKRRLDEHQHKLRAFPAGLPARVVCPLELVMDRARGGRVVGYTMPEISGAELLHRFADPKFRRRGVAASRVASVLRDLHDTVAGLHRSGVVIGDFNDLNVLARDRAAFLIDADSFQFGGYLCTVFSERFVDPLLCDPAARSPVLDRPHNQESDWYAFAVMLMRSLLCVGPYGGVFRPKDRARRVKHGARPLHRVTVFDGEVIYPKAALHYGALPDDMLAHLHGVFVGDVREPFPRALLDSMRWTRCSSCGSEHARAVCPHCIGPARSARATLRVRGQVTAETLFTAEAAVVMACSDGGTPRWLYWDGTDLRREDGVAVATVGPRPNRVHVRTGSGAAVGEGGRVVCFDDSGTTRVLSVDVCAGRPAFAANPSRCFWVESGRLMRDGLLGPVHIGDVLGNQTRIWVGDTLGFGFYRAGGHEVGFTFGVDGRGINEVLRPLGVRGKLVELHCVPGRDRVWLFAVEHVAGDLVQRAVVLDASGVVLAGVSGDHDWLGGVAGACAVGQMLLVPSDAGVVRVEIDAGTLSVTKTFPDTEPFVDRTSQLVATDLGLVVVSDRHIVKITLSNSGGHS